MQDFIQTKSSINLIKTIMATIYRSLHTAKKQDGMSLQTIRLELGISLPIMIRYVNLT